MNYYVIGPDGNKYGPADIALLNTWVAEGRISPITMLETDAGLRLAASTVPGLNFPVPASTPQNLGTPQSSYQSYDGSQSNYYRPGYQHNLFGTSGTEVTLSWVFGALSIFSLCMCSLLSIGLSIAGLILGIVAKRKNQANAGFAIIFNAVLTGLWLILGIGYIAAFSSAISGMR